MKVLILCTGNSCRSQMAEGFLKHYAPDWEIFSAGTKPAIEVNPNAVETMAKVGIDIGGNIPKNVNEFTSEGWDYVISVCGSADKNCPVFKGKVKNRLFFPFDDPAKLEGNKEYIESEFARIRDEIRAKFYEFFRLTQAEHKKYI